jgi:hypothetical protein
MARLMRTCSIDHLTLKAFSFISPLHSPARAFYFVFSANRPETKHMSQKGAWSIPARRF